MIGYKNQPLWIGWGDSLEKK